MPYTHIDAAIFQKSWLDSQSECQIPPSSLPSLPPSCFSTDSKGADDATQLKKSLKARVILVCSSCKVCVHDSKYNCRSLMLPTVSIICLMITEFKFTACYGVKFLPDGPGNWKCSRCTQIKMEVECGLCAMRGGALKPTLDGKWAHIVCAIANPEISFKNVSQREPIDLSNVESSRSTLVSGLFCFLCTPSTPLLC